MALDVLSLTTVAKMIGVHPQTLSNMFYEKELDGARAPLVGRVRCIPRDYVDEIKAILRQRIQSRKKDLEKRLKQLA